MSKKIILSFIVCIALLSGVVLASNSMRGFSNDCMLTEDCPNLDCNMQHAGKGMKHKECEKYECTKNCANENGKNQRKCNAK